VRRERAGPCAPCACWKEVSRLLSAHREMRSTANRAGAAQLSTAPPIHPNPWCLGKHADVVRFAITVLKKQIMDADLGGASTKH
jgi:hypothetical protein